MFMDMKKITLVIALLFSTYVCSAHSKDTTITWYTLPYYDSLGNIYFTRKVFDYIPTKKDSDEFGRQNLIYWRNLPNRRPQKKPINKKKTKKN